MTATNNTPNTAADAARMPLGTRIALARKEARMTQPQLAKASGIAQSNISMIETLKTAPTAKTYDTLMGAIVTHMGRNPVSIDAVDGVLGIVGRSQGKIALVNSLLSAPEPVEWLVEGFLARRYVTMLAGQEGSGKSMVTQTLAVALAEGRSEAFGFRLPGRPMRGLVFDVENVMVVDDAVNGSLVKGRLQAYGLTATGDENLTVAGVQGFDLDKDSDVLDAVLADAENAGAAFDFIILDSFRSLWTSGSENTPEAGRVLTKINRLAHKHNVAIIVIHHTNKAGAAYSGHTSIGSTVAAVWTFSRLVHKDPETGRKAQHATARFLSPYKVRISAEMKARIVSTSGNGITSSKTADDYAAEGFEIDPGNVEETEGE